MRPCPVPARANTGTGSLCASLLPCLSLSAHSLPARNATPHSQRSHSLPCRTSPATSPTDDDDDDEDDESNSVCRLRTDERRSQPSRDGIRPFTPTAHRPPPPTPSSLPLPLPLPLLPLEPNRRSRNPLAWHNSDGRRAARRETKTTLGTRSPTRRPADTPTRPHARAACRLPAAAAVPVSRRPGVSVASHKLARPPTHTPPGHLHSHSHSHWRLSLFPQSSPLPLARRSSPADGHDPYLPDHFVNRSGEQRTHTPAHRSSSSSRRAYTHTRTGRGKKVNLPPTLSPSLSHH